MAKPPALARIPGARRSPFPNRVAPQLLTLVQVPPNGEQWAHEIKYDGYRMLARVQGGSARLISRQGLDWTNQLSQIARAVVKLPIREAWLDGEAVVLESDGRTNFQALRRKQIPQLHYYAFDLMYLDGFDLRECSLAARRTILGGLITKSHEPIRFSGHLVGHGAEFFAKACELGLEGIVSKRIDAPYAGARDATWRKVKCPRYADLVIGGYERPEGFRVGVGRLILGFPDEAGTLRYAGRVERGWSEKEGRALGEKLARIETATSPFGAHGPRREYRWVKPQLVARIAFTEWTEEDKLRHASYKGLVEAK